jgi:hypothetical protein
MTTRRDNKLDREKTDIHALLALLFIAAFSGFIQLFLDTTSWTHWNTLGHSLFGILLIVPAAIYIYRHFYRTLGSKKPVVLFTGLATTLVLLLLWGGGLYLLYTGVTERTRWVHDSHAWLGYAIGCTLFLHLLFHFLRNSDTDLRSKFRTLGIPNLASIAISVTLYLLLITIASALYDSQVMGNPAYAAGPAVEPYDYRYGDHPFKPSQTETASGGFITKKQIANSDTCGSCHTEIFEQWSSSMHAKSASDPAYVTNVNFLTEGRGISATRYCEGCHAPVALLTGELTPGGQHGGTKNTAAFNEGVGCMGCHGITDAVHLKGVASYRYTPVDTYLFQDSDHALGRFIHNLLIRVDPLEHRQAMSPVFLASPEQCATCHNSFMDKEMNYWGWIKLQNEYDAWLESPFSGHNDQDFRTETVQRCQDCHFSKIAARDPSADENGLIASHRSPGGNTAIPWIHGDTAQLDAVKSFLQTGKISVDIEQPTRKDSIQTYMGIDENLRIDDNTPYFLYLGENMDLRVIVTNRMIGHDFPGGTTDINQAWLYVRVTDANKKLVYENGALDAENRVDNTAYKYHSIPVDRQGKAVWKHDLFNMVGEAYSNTIESGKSDIADFVFTVPYDAKGPLTVTAIVKYRKFNQRYAEWALGRKGIELPIVEMARDTLVIPLKNKPVISLRN